MDAKPSLLEQYNIICLSDASDDDLYKIYYIKSDLKNKWYRVIASAFGATSCTCKVQNKNPYRCCSHMKKLDTILKDEPKHIQTLTQIPFYFRFF